MQENIATVVAQIACHDNELPQGSPCSPVISNLIGHLLDMRLARLAKINKCTYSRYVDDITFSTSRKDFPSDLAIPLPGSTTNWKLGVALREKIERSGFKINDKKTQMQWKGSRQVTTGLLVNDKVNIRPEYYLTARSMCHQLFSYGIYYRMMPATVIGGTPVKEVITSLNPLQGILTHIAQVKGRSDLRKPVEKKAEPTAIRKLYRDFLFYKNFVALGAPLILSEGKTDPIYLKAAIRKLPAFQPSPGEMKAGNFVFTIRFMNYSHTVHDVLQLGGGTGDFKHFIIKYNATMKRFAHTPLRYPVVILIDNDDRAKEIFSVAKNHGATKISLSSTDAFYHLGLSVRLGTHVQRPSLRVSSMTDAA